MGGYWPAAYYWPMDNLQHTTAIHDEGKYTIQADRHGVKFIHVPKLKKAVSLTNKRQWLDVDAKNNKQWSSINGYGKEAGKQVVFRCSPT